jgi:cytochrome c oxidase accessory protein FixG
MESIATFIPGSPKKVIPIIPYSVKGKFRNTKTAILLLAFLTFFGTPWMIWHGSSRTGQPIMFDLVHSKMYLFDFTLYPQDLMIFMAIMVFAAALLFMSAAFYGRIFCGFFCFQTIWTDAFRFIETMVQGEAQARDRLKKQPWNLSKIYKIGLTHLLWLILAFATGLTLTLYFGDARRMFMQIIDGTASAVVLQTITIVTITTYTAAGIAREEICRVACPYGKFQAIMQDPSTRTVIYDVDRGERVLGRALPDKQLKTASLRSELGYGDCIDCNYCVNVCPTGVDIRKGFQIDCISCGLCIDACDTIMKKINLPNGLIRFDKMLPNKDIDIPVATSWSKILKAGYFVVLAASAIFIAWALATLEPFSAQVQQQSQPLSTTLSNGDIKSGYNIRLTNKSSKVEEYKVYSYGLPEAAVLQQNSFRVPPGKTYNYTFHVVMSAAASRDTTGFHMSIVPTSNLKAKQEFDLNYITNRN